MEIIWHHDAAEYMPARPKSSYMWEGWRFKEEGGEELDVVEEAPWWERHGVADPLACTKQLQEVATLDANAGTWRLH